LNYTSAKLNRNRTVGGLKQQGPCKLKVGGGASPPVPPLKRRRWSSPWMPGPGTLHITAGVAQLADHRPHGLARSCGTPDSLLLTHGLLPTTGQHEGRYDPQPVTRSTEW